MAFPAAAQGDAREDELDALARGVQAMSFGEDSSEVDRRYEMTEKIGEGTYGTVYKAMCRQTGQAVAIKKIKILPEDEGVPSTALREISLLQDLRHPNVVRLHDVFSSRVSLHLVFECLDMDLRMHLKRSGRMGGDTLRSASRQCFAGLEFCHALRILHRDLKPQNVLVSRQPAGSGSPEGATSQAPRLVLADFGLARNFSVPLKVYTHEVVTLWYRAPEVLLGQLWYGPSMDIWSLGCIVGEMATGQPLFPGDSEIDTIFKIFCCLGTPNDEVWPGVSTLKDFKTRFPQWKDTHLEGVRADAKGGLDGHGLDLLRQCLRYNLVDRASARKLLRHPFLEVAASAQRAPPGASEPSPVVPR